MSRLHTASRRIAVMGEPADPAIHRAMREARTEAVVVLGLDVALLAGLATLDHTQGWAIIGLPWWAWLLVACPPAMMIAALLVFPLAEVSPGRVRNVTVGLLGLLVLGDAAAIAVLLVALAGADGDDLSAATSSRTGPSSGSATSSSSACCCWLLDDGGPRERAARGRNDPDFQYPQDVSRRPGWAPRLSDYLYVALTNAIAVSPTDTMPLTRRAKGLMAVESLTSYAVVVLVVARAVNVLGANS
jgi:hypothetical protein